VLTLILSVALVLMLLVDATVGTARTRRALATFEAVPANRVRCYRRFIAIGWIRAAAATLVTFTAGFSLTEIGVSGTGGGPTAGAPDGAGLAWLVAIVMSLSTGVGAVRLRRSMRAGQVHAQRAKIAALIPRTATERRYAVALAVTAGVTEEIFFRGALIALGIEVFHLPVPAAAALSLVLFAALHAYQGRVGLLNAGFLGLWFTGLTLLAGSLLPAIVMHIAVDLWALLVVPAEPTPRPTEADQPAEPTPRPTEADQPAENAAAVLAGETERAAPFVVIPPPSEQGRKNAPPAVPAIRSPTPAG
jgi:membrane protease YdiL (CAAX protease family)